MSIKSCRTYKLCSVLLLSFSLLFLFPEDCLSFSINSAHPRIFITADTLQTLKARCGVANPTHPEYNTHVSEYENVVAAADAYTAAQIAGFDGLNKGRLCLANSFVYLIEGGSGYYEKAKDMLDYISSLGSDDKSHYGFFTACIIYDWLYNTLSTQDRASYANDIVRYVTTASSSSRSTTFDPYYNDRKYVSSLFAISGQAIYNEDPVNAIEFLSRSITVFNRMMLTQDEIAEDGFIYPIGQPGYFDESIWQSALRVLAGLKLTGVSGPEVEAIDYSSVAKIAYGEIYALIKDNYVVSHNDGYSEADKPWRESRSPDGPFYSAILAKLFEGQEIGRITSYLQDNYIAISRTEKTFTYLGSILFNNKIANSVGSTISSLPLTKVFDDTVLLYRSGWSGLKSDNKEILFNFTCEKHVNGHTHYAKGHFDIWRGYDPLTFASGNYCNTSYQHYLYYGDSLAHNVMLIRNPSENTGSRPNDGGQLTNHGEGDEIDMHGSSAWRIIGHTNEGQCTYTGRIKRVSVSDEYFYSYFHYPTAYSASKLNDISRSVCRLGDYFIVLDRIDGVNAAFKKKWLLHSIGIPTIMDSGSWDGGAPVNGNGGTPNQTSNNAKLLKVSEGTSSLFIKSIYPLNTIIHRVGGAAEYRWYSYNENTNYSQGAPSGPQYGNWRIEIESNENTEDDIFLTVLYPTDISGTIADTVRLSGENYTGVQIKDTTNKIFIASNSVNEMTKEGSYNFSVTSDSTVQVLVCDLEAGNYKVYKNDALIQSSNVTEDSALFFETSRGGNFQILKSSDSEELQPPTNLRTVMHTN